jgi:hypothetical protein
VTQLSMLVERKMNFDLGSYGLARLDQS